MKTAKKPNVRKTDKKKVSKTKRQSLGPRKRGSLSKVNTVWFKECLRKAGLVQRHLSEALGLDTSAISLIFSGKRRIQMGEALIISDLIGQPLEAVLLNAGLKPPGDAISTNTSSIDVVGYVTDQLFTRLDLSGLRGPRKVEGGPGLSSDNVRALRVQTEGTAFSGLDGAIIYFQEVLGVDPGFIGKLCVVALKGSSDIVVRVLKRGYQPGQYDLGLLDGTTTHRDVQIQSAWPVLWLKIG